MIVPLDDPSRVRAMFAAAFPHRIDEYATQGAARWILVEDGAPLGYAALSIVNGRKCRLDVIIDESQRRRGFGTQLLAHVIAFAKDARSLQARPLEEAGIAFCARHGFRETMRMHHLELVLADARLDPHRSSFDRIAGDGIAIVTLADFAARAHDGEAAFLDLFGATRTGWPDPDPDLPGEPPTEVVWIPHVRRHLATDPTPIVAEQNGRLVGFTSMLGTGVRPELRNRGIATALKVAAIDAAIARGETVMRSSTGNPPMIHINAKLGFREVLVEQRMVRLL